MKKIQVIIIIIFFYEHFGLMLSAGMYLLFQVIAYFNFLEDYSDKLAAGRWE